MQLWYPNASRRMLGTQTEPLIGTPRVLIFHTMVGHLQGSDAMFRQGGYDGTESHFGVGGPWEPGDLDGAVWQWQSLDRQADAQNAGNAYATSIETADGGKPERPWTDKQLAALVDLTAWWCRQTGAPARIVAGPGERGIGYHAQFDAWAPDGRPCPGPVRIRQLRDIVVPRVRAVLAPVEGAPVATPVVLHRVLRKRLPMMTGADVRAIQAAAGMPGHDVDGRYWTDTKAAVERFQRTHHLDVDGRVGPLTAAAMGLGWDGQP